MKHNVKEIQATLMNKADNMAAAAVMFGSHGYDQFINAREDFKMTLEEIEKEAQEENEKESLSL